MYLLDKAKVITGSDSATAKIIGMSKHSISSIRAGRRALSPYQAGKLAELCQERWYDHALPSLAAHARTPDEKAFWLGKSEALAKIVGTATAGAFLIIGGVCLSVVGNDAKAQTRSESVVNDFYIVHLM